MSNVFLRGGILRSDSGVRKAGEHATNATVLFVFVQFICLCYAKLSLRSLEPLLNGDSEGYMDMGCE